MPNISGVVSSAVTRQDNKEETYIGLSDAILRHDTPTKVTLEIKKKQTKKKTNKLNCGPESSACDLTVLTQTAVNSCGNCI